MHGELPVPRLRPQWPEIFVVDGHGDAFEYWHQARPGPLSGLGSAGRAPFTVLHVDSHADMHLDFCHDDWTQPSPSWQPPRSEELLELVRSKINIMNFQPAAIACGLVDAVVWIRSDFQLGKYNSPAPGHYRQRLGLPDYSLPDNQPLLGKVPPQIGSGHPVLCVWDETDCAESLGPFRVYSDFIAEQSGREILEERIPEMPVETNTSWEELPLHWQSGRAPLASHSKAYSLSVLTAAQFLAEPDSALAVLRDPWILDIDLDYFATFCPSLAGPIQVHGWQDPERSEAFASWAVPFRMLVTALESSQPALFGPERFQQTALVLTTLGTLGRTLSIEELQRRLRTDLDTSLRALVELLNGLTDLQLAQWSALRSEDWSAVMQPHGPHHFSGELLGDVSGLESLLRRMPTAPALVTVARSSDLYLPSHAASLVEWEVLLMLRRLWPISLPCKLPSTIRSCGSDEIASILQGVRFHQGLHPAPWPESSMCGDFEVVD